MTTITTSTATKSRKAITKLVGYYRRPMYRPDALLLQPLIFYSMTRHGRGLKSEIANEMTRMSGRRVTRDMVRNWLHPTGSRRRQPSLFYGLLLIAAGDRIVKQKNKTNPQ